MVVLNQMGWEHIFPDYSEATEGGGTEGGAKRGDQWTQAPGNSGVQDADDSGIVRTGRYAIELDGVNNLDQLDIQGSAHVGTLSTTKIYWHIGHYPNSSVGSNKTNGDYIWVARFGAQSSESNSITMLGILCEYGVGPPETLTYKLVKIARAADGTETVTVLDTAGATVGFGSWHWLVVMGETGGANDGDWQWWKDGSSEGTGNDTAIDQYGPLFALWASQQNAKGVTAMKAVYDDCIVTDGNTGLLGITAGIVAYQPTGDFAGYTDWTGSADATNKYRNVDDYNDDADEVDRISDGTLNNYQVFTVADEASGTVYGVRLTYLGTSGLMMSGKTDGSIIDIGAASHAAWDGRQLGTTPEGGAWSLTKLNALHAGIKNNRGAGAYIGCYTIHAVGLNLNRPSKNPALAARRRWPGGVF